MLAPLRAELRAEADLITIQPYTVWQASADMSAPYGLRNYWRSSCLPALDDAAIDWIAAHCLEFPTPMSMIHIHHLEGAVKRKPVGDAADGLRQNAYVVNFLATWPSPNFDATAIAWARHCSEGIGPVRARRAYVNFSGADPDHADVSFDSAIFEQLGDAKRRYDSDAMFV